MADGYRVELIERDADPLFFSPSDMTGSRVFFGADNKHEFIWDAEWAGDLKSRTGRGQVPDDAINRPAAELNRSGLQHSLS